MYQNSVDLVNARCPTNDGSEMSKAPRYSKQLKHAECDFADLYVKIPRLHFLYLGNVNFNKHQPLHQGFNSCFHIDDMPLQRVAYMDPIFDSPT